MAPGIGLAELLLIAIVALLFIKPERLPGALRSLGSFYRDARRYFNAVSSSLRAELNEFKDAPELGAFRDPLGLREIKADLKKEAAELDANLRAAPNPRDDGAPGAQSDPIAAAEIYPELREASRAGGGARVLESVPAPAFTVAASLEEPRGEPFARSWAPGAIPPSARFFGGTRRPRLGNVSRTRIDAAFRRLWETRARLARARARTRRP
ncbi:MAG: hypothetical protein LBO66_05640 [Deltaproteobacteria bacterium]|jgi:sec-independent protein translocase protein TatB|nr:hypothetical protein [Deltaproteobacteria bacterium]